MPATLKIDANKGMENTPAQSAAQPRVPRGRPPSRSLLQLLGGFHQTDFTGHGTARAAGKQNSRQYGTQFAQQGSGNHIAQNIGGFEFCQLRIALQAQYHADKQAGDGNNQDRQHACKVNLADAQARAGKRRT